MSQQRGRSACQDPKGLPVQVSGSQWPWPGMQIQVTSRVFLRPLPKMVRSWVGQRKECELCQWHTYLYTYSHIHIYLHIILSYSHIYKYIHRHHIILSVHSHYIKLVYIFTHNTFIWLKNSKDKKGYTLKTSFPSLHPSYLVDTQIDLLHYLNNNIIFLLCPTKAFFLHVKEYRNILPPFSHK